MALLSSISSDPGSRVPHDQTDDDLVKLILLLDSGCRISQIQETMFEFNISHCERGLGAGVIRSRQITPRTAHPSGLQGAASTETKYIPLP